jgi:hypothetical protein
MKTASKKAKPSMTSDLVTLNEITQRFRVSKKSIALWRQSKRPGLPEKSHGKESLSAWVKYFAANPSAGHDDGKPTEDRETLLCRKLEVEIALKKIQLDEAEGRMIARSEVDDRDLRIGAAVAAAMRMLETELPQLCLGLTLDRSRPLVKDKVRQVQAILADGLSDFWKSRPEKK